MTSRHNMLARDSEGRRVSLLNDDHSSTPNDLSRPLYNHKPSRYEEYDDANMVRSHSEISEPSIQSSPRTPYLERSDSYDSNTTNDPISPTTPSSDYNRQVYSSTTYEKDAHFENRQYEEYDTLHQQAMSIDIQQHPHARNSGVPPKLHQRTLSDQQLYDSEFHESGVPESKTKRYPCRYRDTHNCEKSFTTSGHASRHSKIHTAEKAVKCTHPGCQKKFTRADNMKQHLETHNKNARERSRSQNSSSTSNSTPASMNTTLTRPAGIQRPSSTTGRNAASLSEKSRSQSPRHHDRDSYFEHATYGAANVHMHSPQIDPQLMSVPIRILGGSANRGLDALAAVAAIQTQS